MKACPKANAIRPARTKPVCYCDGALRTLEPLPSCWPGRCLTVIWNSENITPRPAMPLTRLKNEFLEEDGVRFLMADEVGNTVACIVSHEALRDHTERVHLNGSDSEVFEAYRELIEGLASEAFDAEGPFDQHGRVLVTSEVLARVTRSA